MDQILIGLSIGPVQEFIAAARRTRDLWFGSHMLSEISRAAARGMVLGAQEQGSSLELIVPHSLDGPQPDSNAIRQDSSVSNKVWGVLTGSCSPESVVARAREEAEKQWVMFCAEAFGKVRDWVRQDIWTTQQKGVVEFYAAWSTFTDDAYPAARDDVDQLLSARKALRDFEPGSGRLGVPKSSLDGARESVCWFEQGRSSRDSRNIPGIRQGEHLDLVGVVKRVVRGDREVAFPSVVQIAVNPWLRGIFLQRGTALRLLNGLQDILREPGICLGRVDDQKYPQFGDFPFDASILLPSRARITLEESAAPSWCASDDSKRNRVLDQLRELHKHAGEPSSYLAVVAADGDHMGKYISSLTKPEAHRNVSRQLEDFSAQARAIVGEFSGVCIYAGGDDVLGFVPLDECLNVARRLHTAFSETVGSHPEADQVAPTLSVGIAVGHCLEPMEDLLDLARKAEAKAKDPDRNGLAVTVQTRSGGEAITVRSGWSDHPEEKIHEFAVARGAGQIPSRLPYELRQLDQMYGEWSGNKEILMDMVRADVRRILLRKRPESGEYLPERQVEEWVGRIQERQDLKTLYSQMLVAMHIATALRQSGRVSKEATA